MDNEQGQCIKKVARWQQFGAANELVKRAMEIDKPRSWRRGLVSYAGIRQESDHAFRRPEDVVYS